MTNVAGVVAAAGADARTATAAACVSKALCYIKRQGVSASEVQCLRYLVSMTFTLRGLAHGADDSLIVP